MTPEHTNVVSRMVLQAVPAIAGAATSLLVGWTFGESLMLAGAIVALQGLFWAQRYPMHLLPLAAHLAAIVLPLGGVVLVAVLSALAGDPVGLAAISAPIGIASASGILSLRLRELLRSRSETRIAVIGSARLGAALSEELEANGLSGTRVVGWIERAGDPHEGRLRVAGEPPLLGSLDSLRDTVTEHRIDLLIHGSTGKWAEGPEDKPIPRLEVFESVASACLDLRVRLLEASQFYEDHLGHVPLGTINSAWFQYIMHPRFRPGSGLSKRALDLTIGLLLVPFVAPVVALAAVAIKLFDRGPVFFKQRRLGAGGSEIEVLKLRSMRVDSEADGVARWSTEDDPRVTPLGRFLRRTHVDEFPQLWNVLRGDMTLVGPRPERPEITPSLMLNHVHYDRRHLVKPGITGWAQVRCGYGGSDTGTGWKLCHDLYYLKHRNAVLDVMIMIETLRVSANDVQFEVRAPDERFILSPSAANDAAAAAVSAEG